VTSNIIYFYILMEVSIVYFIYLFIYRAYKERSRSLILIVLYILIFRLPFIIIILNIATTRIAIMKVRNVSVSIGLLRVWVFINKIPLFGFHYWLLKAHSYCTTWGRIILARVILKVGVLGLVYLYQVRYCLSSYKYLKLYLYVRICISRMNILYITDIKMIIAQTRVTHISFLGLSLLLNRRFSIKLRVVFGFIHGIVRALIFAFGEVLAQCSKSRNILILKKVYIIRLIFIRVILLNNSFPITPYMWCELWIFIIMARRVSSVMRCAFIVVIMILTCNILFFQWVVIIKHQYLIVMSDIKQVYLFRYTILRLIFFFIILK